MTGHPLVSLPVTTPVPTACDLLQQGRYSAHIGAAVLSACVDDGCRGPLRAGRASVGLTLRSRRRPTRQVEDGIRCAGPVRWRAGSGGGQAVRRCRHTVGGVPSVAMRDRYITSLTTAPQYMSIVARARVSTSEGTSTCAYRTFNVRRLVMDKLISRGNMSPGIERFPASLSIWKIR